MTAPVFSAKGTKSSTITLPKEIFAAPIRPTLVAQAVRVYLANARQATKKTKTRGEVRGSTRKIYRQKGTGRARHGDKQAPIFVGGGIAHGPTGNENYSLKLSKKMRRQALFSALTLKAQAKEIAVISKLDSLKPKTKTFTNLITKVTSQISKSKTPKTALILADTSGKNIIRGVRNISFVSLIQAKQLNTYEVLNSRLLLFSKHSLAALKQTFLKKPDHK